jgi:hypothetical protein
MYPLAAILASPKIKKKHRRFTEIDPIFGHSSTAYPRQPQLQSFASRCRTGSTPAPDHSEFPDDRNRVPSNFLFFKRIERIFQQRWRVSGDR